MFKQTLLLSLGLNFFTPWPPYLLAKTGMTDAASNRTTLSRLKSDVHLLMDPSINGISPFANVVGRYEKFELRVDLTAQFENPYDYDEVHLSALFTSPSGQKRIVDGFYMWDLTINEQDGSLSTNSSEGEFRIRFAPDEIGLWTYDLQLTDSNGMATATTQSFQCIASTMPQNKGYIRSNQTNFLHFDKKIMTVR